MILPHLEASQRILSLSYDELRDHLTIIDYESLYHPLAQRAKKQFEHNYEKFTISAREALDLDREAKLYLQMQANKRGGKLIFSNDMEEKSAVNFNDEIGKGDNLRIYIAPKLTPQDLKVGIDTVIEAVYDLEVACQVKLHGVSWFKPDPYTFLKYELEDKTCFVGDKLNRMIVYFDLKERQAITSFFNRLAVNQVFLQSLEDSGEWKEKYRIILAPGISFVEGKADISWDHDYVPLVLKPALELLNNPELTLPPAKKSRGNQVGIDEQMRKAILESRSLAPLGRYTNMPALLLQEL